LIKSSFEVTSTRVERYLSGRDNAASAREIAEYLGVATSTAYGILQLMEVFGTVQKMKRGGRHYYMLKGVYNEEQISAMLPPERVARIPRRKYAPRSMGYAKLPGREGFLEEHLSTMRVLASSGEGPSAARARASRIVKISSSITRITNIIQPSLAQIISSADALDEKEIINKLKSWHEKLEDYSASLASPIESYLPQPYSQKDIHGLFIPTDGFKIIKVIQDKAHEEFPITTPEQDAWDTLTRLEENIKALEEAQENYRIAEIPFKRANLLYSTFLETRNQILQDTYDEVRDRFVDIYRHLHGTDESSFGASISPTDAGLNFEVDFYGGVAIHPMLCIARVIKIVWVYHYGWLFQSI